MTGDHIQCIVVKLDVDLKGNKTLLNAHKGLTFTFVQVNTTAPLLSYCQVYLGHVMAQLSVIQRINMGLCSF